MEEIFANVADARSRPRILLAQLNSNGDCLYTTTVARQIKTDFPGCHLTWAIGSMCRSIITGNPDVDDVWEISLRSLAEVPEVWRTFKAEALRRRDVGEFSLVYFTQFSPDYLDRYDGGIRSSHFRGYTGKITVPATPVLRLTPAEVSNVRYFAEAYHLTRRSPIILFECSPKSGQSFMTPDFAMSVAHLLIGKFPRACLIFSSDKTIFSVDERIIDASVLSLRENAELSKYCSILVGCSSGISWICSSDWAKRLPTVQLIDPKAMWVNSVARDHERCGLSADHLIELTTCTPEHVSRCVIAVLEDGIASAKRSYHEVVPAPLHSFLEIEDQLFKQNEPVRALRFIARSIQAEPQLLHHKCLRRHFLILSQFVANAMKSRIRLVVQIIERHVCF
jgi:hypothetical protein